MSKEIKKSTFPQKRDIVMYIALILVMSVIVGAVAQIVAGGVAMNTPFSSMVVYGSSMGLSLVAMLLYRRSRGGRGNIIRYRLRWFNAWLILWGLLAITAIGVVEEPLFELMPHSWLEMVENVIGTGVWAICSSVILAPVLEELIFRGVILGTVRSRWGAVPAIAASALLFGIIHGVPQQVINAAAIGVVLGGIYVATDSIVAVIVLHAINNGLSYALTTLFPDSDGTLRSFVTNDVLYWGIYGVCVLYLMISLVSAVAALRYRRRRARAMSNKNSEEHV